MAIYGGFRRGELCALRWENVDFEKRTVFVCAALCRVGRSQVIKTPKTDAGFRTVCLPDECFDALSILRGRGCGELGCAEERDCGECGCEKVPSCSEYVFTKARTAEPLSLQLATNEFRRILLRHNRSCRPGEELPLIRLHDLRHTSATLLLASNTDIETVARRLGHSRASVTLDVYGHALPGKDYAAAQLLGEIIGG